MIFWKVCSLPHSVASESVLLDLIGMYNIVINANGLESKSITKSITRAYQLVSSVDALQTCPGGCLIRLSRTYPMNSTNTSSVGGAQKERPLSTCRFGLHMIILS